MAPTTSCKALKAWISYCNWAMLPYHRFNPGSTCNHSLLLENWNYGAQCCFYFPNSLSLTSHHYRLDLNNIKLGYTCIGRSHRHNVLGCWPTDAGTVSDYNNLFAFFATKILSFIFIFLVLGSWNCYYCPETCIKLCMGSRQKCSKKCAW